MYKGKSTCRELKKIRKMIAEQNNIPLEDSECHYEGDCAGTCPKCDAEVRFLENALRKGQQLGKAVALSGAALSLAACSYQTTGKPLPSLDTVSSVSVVQNDSTDVASTHNPDSIDNTEELDNDILFGIIDETEPCFPGGIDALYKFIKDQVVVYPKLLEAGADIEGTVYVEFVVEKDGNLSHIKVLRGVHPALDSEAVSIVRQMPKWEPGKQRGKSVRTVYRVPIEFKLAE